MRWITPTDVRAIALFRVALAAASLRELCCVWPDRHDFLTNFGDAATAGAPLGQLGGDALADSTVTALLVFHALALLGLLLARSPRLCCTAAACLQLWRLCRNPLVSATDSYLLCWALFFATMMPLGVPLTSLPQQRNTNGFEPAPDEVSSLGPRVLLALCYASAAVSKLVARRSDHPGAAMPWLDGTAVAESLACCEHQKPLAILLLRCPILCKVLTYSTLLLESSGPIALLFADGCVRMLTVALLLCFHFTLHSCLELANFSAVCAALLCLNIPSDAFDLVEEVWRTSYRQPTVMKRHSPSEAAIAAASPPSTATRTAIHVSRAGRQAISYALIGMSVLGTIESHLVVDEYDPVATRPSNGARSSSTAWFVEVEEWVHRACKSARQIGLASRFDMFALPPDDCGWWVIEADIMERNAATQGGDLPLRVLDAHKVRHRPHLSPLLSQHRPDVPAWQHQSSMWQSYYERLSSEWRVVDAESIERRRDVLTYHCKRVPGAVQMRLVLFVEDIRLTSNGHVSVSPAKRHQLLAHECYWRSLEAVPSLEATEVAQQPQETSQTRTDADKRLPAVLELFHSEVPTNEWCVAATLALQQRAPAPHQLPPNCTCRTHVKLPLARLIGERPSWPLTTGLSC